LEPRRESAGDGESRYDGEGVGRRDWKELLANCRGGRAAPTAASCHSPPPATGGFDILQLSDEEEKVHRDAKRFAGLLVSEIELYNKAKVQDGRKSGDLYKRLKSDIDRSRQTYEKRFGKEVGKQYDYLHEELVRILAGSDAALLGSEYPGPTV